MLLWAKQRKNLLKNSRRRFVKTANHISSVEEKLSLVKSLKNIKRNTPQNRYKQIFG